MSTVSRSLRGDWRYLGSVLVLAFAVLAHTVPAPAQAVLAEQAIAVDAALGEASRLFNEAEYERALPFLDRAVEQLEPHSGDSSLRSRLVSAYELRARTYFGVGDRDRARTDFEALVRLNPSHVLPAVSPAIQELFEEIRNGMVGELFVVVDPTDAVVQVDGVQVSGLDTGLALLAGIHTLEVGRANYRSASEQVAVHAGLPLHLNIQLERIFASVRLSTVPPDVEVRVNGTPRGRTSKGVPIPEFVEWARAQGVSPDLVSSPFELDGLSPGIRYNLLFQRDCFASKEVVIEPPRVTDLRLDPVVLEPTVGVVTVASDVEGTAVYLDGRALGSAPQELKDICEGRHVLELRTPFGRDVRRLDVRRGASIDVRGQIRPAFAIMVSGTGPQAAEAAQAVEDAFSNLSTLTVFVPDDGLMQRTWAAEQTSPAALAVDVQGQPAGADAARLTRTARSALTRRLCRSFDEAQGILWVGSSDYGTQALVAWWACGSATPDVFTVKLDEPNEVRAVAAAVDGTLAPVRPSLGLLGIDVGGVPGVVVADLDPAGAAAAAGIEVADTIVGFNGQAVPDHATLERLLLEAARSAATLEIRSRSGQTRTVNVATTKRPRVVGLTDRTFTPNPAVGRLRMLAAASRDPAELAAIRLSLAVVLIKVEAWSDALSELQSLKLPEGPGVSDGTVQYLQGLCHEALGQRLQAQEAWQKAASSEATLTEDGPSIKALAQAKLEGPG